MDPKTESELVEFWEKHGIYCSVTGAGKIARITSISAHRTKNVDAVCRFIPMANAATDISFRESDVSDMGFTFLKGHEHLKKVKLEGTKITGDGYEVLTTLPKLHHLSCSPDADPDVAMKWIGQLTNLDNLRIAYSKIRDRDLPSLSHLVNLTNLDLCHNDIDAGAAIVTQLPKLKWLSLSATKVTEPTLAQIVMNQTIEELYLEFVEVSDAGLRHVAKLPRMTTFCCSGTHITTEGLASLSVLSEMGFLSFDLLHVKKEMVDTFKQMKRLTALWFRDCKADAPTKKALKTAMKKAVPRCDVAFLGDPE